MGNPYETTVLDAGRFSMGAFGALVQAGTVNPTDSATDLSRIEWGIQGLLASTIVRAIPLIRLPIDFRTRPLTLRPCVLGSVLPLLFSPSLSRLASLGPLRVRRQRTFKSPGVETGTDNWVMGPSRIRRHRRRSQEELPSRRLLEVSLTPVD